MKKNTKKQSNSKKIVTPLKKKKSVSVKAKSPISKKKLKKVATKTKTKAALKNAAHVVLKQKTKKITKKTVRQTKNNNNYILSFGNVSPSYGRILLLIVAIIFVASLAVLQNMTKVEQKIEQPAVAGVEIKRNTSREKEINDLVQGYPIAKMTRYIAKQDPKVAAFMIAIAKKESAWGDRKPVLNGEDCYNYWGFRLKSDRMGSGGHTCFDSPEEAVDIVGARLSHLVNDEKIDTPKEMVVWKCGYACNGPEAAGSEKWIKDVDYYYKQMIN
jgi:hypothetical protein